MILGYYEDERRNKIDNRQAMADQLGIPLNALANDSDCDGDVLTITEVSQPVNGSAVIENNQILYTPNNNFTARADG